MKLKEEKTADPDVIIKYHVWMKLNREEEEADGYPDVLVEASREVAVTILALLLHLRASIQLFLTFLIFSGKTPAHHWAPQFNIFFSLTLKLNNSCQFLC